MLEVYHFAARDGLASFSKDNRAIFFLGGKEVQGSFPGCLLFENTRKNLKSNLVLVVVLVLESKGLYNYTLGCNWNQYVKTSIFRD